MERLRRQAPVQQLPCLQIDTPPPRMPFMPLSTSTSAACCRLRPPCSGAAEQRECKSGFCIRLARLTQALTSPVPPGHPKLMLLRQRRKNCTLCKDSSVGRSRPSPSLLRQLLPAGRGLEALSRRQRGTPALLLPVRLLRPLSCCAWLSARRWRRRRRGARASGPSGTPSCTRGWGSGGRDAPAPQKLGPAGLVRHICPNPGAPQLPPAHPQ